jgi:fatty acid desaturase
MSGESAVTAGDLLTLDELRTLRETSTLRGVALVLHAWTVIAGGMLLYATWPSVLTLLIAVAVIGSRQLGLAVLMHEAAHWRLSPRHRLNDRLGAWLCAAPVFADLPRYRRRHHEHHRRTQQADDPDLALASVPGPLWLAALGDLGGLTALWWLLAWRPWRGGGSSPSWRQLRRPLAANAALVAALAVAGHAHLYLLLWLLPRLTWYPLLARIRDAAEHARVGDADDVLRNARTTAAGPLARAFLAPYWVNHHLEHHLLVFVPCWRLPAAHALLLAKGHGPAMELAPGYAGVLRRVTSGRGASRAGSDHE